MAARGLSTHSSGGSLEPAEQSELGTTIVELTGGTLHGVAQERSRYGGETPQRFTLLNETDRLDEDAAGAFLLTTNRADLLEPALASGPGRVDQAVHIELPDRESRQRLVELYRRAWTSTWAGSTQPTASRLPSLRELLS